MSTLLIPYKNAMNGGIRHHIIQDRKSRMKESRFKRIALKFLAAYLIYFLISHILFEDALPRRSLSPCKKKKSTIPRRLSDYYGQMVNEKEIVNKRGDSSLTNLYNRVRYLIADDEDEAITAAVLRRHCAREPQLQGLSWLNPLRGHPADRRTQGPLGHSHDY